MIDPLNPHVTLAQLKAFYKKAPPFAMPPPEGIIPGMCRALERAIRNPHTWGKRKHYKCTRTAMSHVYADAYKREREREREVA
jgi:hypothetical protein